MSKTCASSLKAEQNSQNWIMAINSLGISVAANILNVTNWI